MLWHNSCTLNSEIQNIVDFVLPHQKIKDEIDKMRLGRKASGPNPENQINSVAKYTRDITNEAIKGKIDPVMVGTKKLGVRSRL